MPMRYLAVILLLAGCPSRSPGGDDDDDGGSCATLDEAACEARTDCVADVCFNCSCTPTFAGCREPSDPQTGCPELGCADPLCCGAEADCPDGTGCLPPGGDPGCGACVVADPPCERDSECAMFPGFVCDVPRCSCDGQKGCIAGCADDTTCNPGQVCRNGRCELRPCNTESDCPEHFVCGNGLCARRACEGDAACPGGFCVEGACHDAYGTCTPPAP